MNEVLNQGEARKILHAEKSKEVRNFIYFSMIQLLAVFSNSRISDDDSQREYTPIGDLDLMFIALLAQKLAE